jgi:ankyrin repeat protein
MLRHMIDVVHADITSPNAVGVTPLIFAARQGLNAICMTILDGLHAREGDDAVRAHINHQTSSQRLSALDGAATRGHPSTIALLAARGADFMCRRANGRTPLHSAAAYGHLACIEVLLDLGADVDAQAVDGSRPVDLVTMSCSIEAWPSVQHDECIAALNAAAEAKRQ